MPPQAKPAQPLNVLLFLILLLFLIPWCLFKCWHEPTPEELREQMRRRAEVDRVYESIQNEKKDRAAKAAAEKRLREEIEYQKLIRRQ